MTCEPYEISMLTKYVIYMLTKLLNTYALPEQRRQFTIVISTQIEKLAGATSQHYTNREVGRCD